MPRGDPRQGAGSRSRVVLRERGHGRRVSFCFLFHGVKNVYLVELDLDACLIVLTLTICIGPG